jgi:5'-phosphate synthase pdxT subunit
MKRVAVLAVQGAFIEHEKMLTDLGAECVELRCAKDLDRPYDGLVLPGGESTVQGKLLKELGMFDTLHKKITDGLPVLATCAGLILLAEKIAGEESHWLGTLPVLVKRNAYGRQSSSFSQLAEVEGIGSYPLEFIRAPYIERVGKDVTPLASDAAGHIVAVKYKNQLAMAFHPELTSDVRIHQTFLNML